LKIGIIETSGILYTQLPHPSVKYQKLLIVLCTLLLTSCSLFGVKEKEETPPPEQGQPAAVEEQTTPEPPAEEGEDLVLISDRERSSIALTARKGDLSYDANFGDFQLQFALNPVSPSDFTTAIAGFAVPLQSLTTEDPEFTSYLLSGEFLGADEYPLATFFSSSIEHMDGTSYVVNGELTIRGVTNFISFPAGITKEYVTAHYVLRLSAFNLNDSAGFDDEVPIDVEMYFQ